MVYIYMPVVRVVYSFSVLVTLHITKAVATRREADI